MAVTYLTFWALQLVAVARFWTAFNPADWRTWWYIAVAVLLPALILLATAQQERLLRLLAYERAAGSRPAELRKPVEPQ
jgi:hypothetical protein